MHLFPKDYASEEVRSALVDIGVEIESAHGEVGDGQSGTPGRKARKEDFVYLEDREELDAEEAQNGGEIEDQVQILLPRPVLNTDRFLTGRPLVDVTRKGPPANN